MICNPNSALFYFYFATSQPAITRDMLFSFVSQAVAQIGLDFMINKSTYLWRYSH